MKILSVFDKEFKEYGRVISGVDFEELMVEMDKIPMPEQGVSYEPAIESLEKCKAFDYFTDSVFGGMPAQLGMCWGDNTQLNCLEYHRNSEFNLGAGDFVMLVAKESEVEDFMLDTSCVKAFRAPKGVLIEVYASTLHYAPCSAVPGKGFRVLIALPRGTNTEKPALKEISQEDKYLVARNKWLLPHPDSSEAKDGAVVALKGTNIDIANLI